MKRLLRWISNMTWVNMIVWYILFTIFSGLVHHAGPIWLIFTSMIIIKLTMNPKDAAYKLTSGSTDD